MTARPDVLRAGAQLRGEVICRDGAFLAERGGRYLPRFPA